MTTYERLDPEDPLLLRRSCDCLASPPSGGCLVGLDGFCDHIYRAIGRRSGEEVLWLETIGAFAGRLPATGSINIELDLQAIRMGGNAPLLAQGLAALGVDCTLVGALGWPMQDPLFAPLEDKGVLCRSVAPVAHTFAIEFQDGKLMLGDMPGLREITWEVLEERLGQGEYGRLWERAGVAALVNWTMLPSLTDVWRRLAEMPRHPRWLFVDLSDPAKRSSEEILDALHVLRAFPLPVILGVNEREARHLSLLLGVEVDPRGEAWASALREALDLGALLLHTSRWAAAATPQATYWVPVRTLAHPVTLTGAGDHFNAAALGALLRGAPWDLVVWIASASARRYVATGRSTTLEDWGQTR